jgi:hypothetical protein
MRRSERWKASEGEPPVFTFQSFIYYLRLLEGYQLFALLFLLMAAGIAFVLSRRALRDPRLWTVLIFGGWFVMTLLRTKDTRFTMPLLPLLLIPAGALLAHLGKTTSGRVAQVAVLMLLSVQAYAANYGISWLPRQVVLMRGYTGSLQWDWQLYSQHYFDILGEPRRENWRQKEIIDRVYSEAGQRGARSTLTLVPDLPRFDTSNFQLLADLAKVPVVIGHAGSRAGFEGFDFVIVTEKEQGMPWTTRAAPALTEMVRNDPAVFKRLTTYDLPNGDAAHLYFIQRMPDKQ